MHLSSDSNSVFSGQETIASRDLIWCSTRPDLGLAEEFSTYFVLAGRVPRASMASAGGRGRERRVAVCSSGPYVAHSPALRGAIEECRQLLCRELEHLLYWIGEL